MVIFHSYVSLPEGRNFVILPKCNAAGTTLEWVYSEFEWLIQSIPYLLRLNLPGFDDQTVVFKTCPSKVLWSRLHVK